MADDQKHMHCMEVWGGNRVTDSGVIMPGLDAWIYSQPCEHESEGGDVHYVSTCAAEWSCGCWSQTGSVKYKCRKGYHKTIGHRQNYVNVPITGINV